MDKMQGNKEVEDFEPGSQCYLKRPQSVVAKNFKLNSLGPYEAISCNDSVVKIKDDTGQTDFVHRSHVHPKLVRNSQFDIFPNVFLPPPPPLRVVDKPTEVKKSIITDSEPIERNNPNGQHERYPKRTRKFVEPLNISSTRGKSYETHLRTSL
jgi:hypothetical protein